MRHAFLWLACAAACGGDSGTASDTGSEAGTSGASQGSSGDADGSEGSSAAATTGTDGGSSGTDGGSGGSSGSSGGSSGSTGAADGSSSGESSTTGVLPDGCAGIDVIELLDPMVTPIDAASWLPGGSVTVGATLSNDGPDFLDYPSIVVESDHDLVTSASPNNSLFGILQGQAVPLSVVFDADASVPSGTQVTFTIRMATLDTVCPNGAVVEVVGTVQ
ncbi:MAG: hypothetical protein K1X88_02965 [Nannocystaceae bacterium]|nr:hypothetical protein [Nannocystaceae bacterium]